MKLTMPDGRPWIPVEKRGARYHIGSHRLKPSEVIKLAGITPNALGSRMSRYDMDAATAFNAPHGPAGILGQREMRGYLDMLASWPDYPLRKPNGAVAEPVSRPIMPTIPADMLTPRQRPQEVDVRVTVSGDHHETFESMLVCLDKLTALSQAILHELHILNGPPPSAFHEPEDKSHDMD
jgi:hypothetical protein